nr:TetR family transcriptional regulator C-terminal domain-containing protein [Zhihengliuella flava]
MLASPHEQITTFELLLRGQRITDEKEREAALAVNRQMYDAWISSTASIFDAGARHSGITPATDTTVAARFAVAGIDGISIQHFSDPDEERSWQMIDELIESLQALLRPRDDA